MNPYNNQFQPEIGERREPGLVLLYGIISCGIYYFYFIHRVSREMLAFDGEPDTDPGMEVLLSIVTCGLYTIYWDYKVAGKLIRMQEKVGLMPTDNRILFLVLNLIGLGMVPSMIEQGHLNDIWNRAQQNYARTGSYYAIPYV
jgi:hypothetical protein